MNKAVSVADVAKLFGGGGHEMAAAFRIANGSLADNEADIIQKIRDFQAGRPTGKSPEMTSVDLAPTLPFETAVPAPPAAAEPQPVVPDLDALKAKQASLQS